MPHNTSNGTATKKPRTRRISPFRGRSVASQKAYDANVARDAAAAAAAARQEAAIPSVNQPMTGSEMASLLRGEMRISPFRGRSVASQKAYDANVARDAAAAAARQQVVGPAGLPSPIATQIPTGTNSAVAPGSQSDPRASLFSPEPGAVFTGSELSGLVAEATPPPGRSVVFKNKITGEIITSPVFDTPPSPLMDVSSTDYPSAPTGDDQSRNEYWYARTGGVDFENPYPEGLELPSQEARDQALQGDPGKLVFLSDKWWNFMDENGFDPITGTPLNPDMNDPDRMNRIWAANGISRGEEPPSTPPVVTVKDDNFTDTDTGDSTFESIAEMLQAAGSKVQVLSNDYAKARNSEPNSIEWWAFVKKYGLDPLTGLVVDPVTGDPLSGSQSGGGF